MSLVAIAGRWRDERGLTLVELLIASAISVTVLAVSLMVVSEVERGFGIQLDGASAREEARFAADWIASELQAAGSNPYDIETSACPAAGTVFRAVGVPLSATSVRVQADVGPPNALLGGLAGACVEVGEDITIAYDPATLTVTRRDMNIDPAPAQMTDTLITNLQFGYLDVNRVVTANAAAVAFITIAVTAQSRTRNPHTGAFDTFTAQTDVRLRMR